MVQYVPWSSASLVLTQTKDTSNVSIATSHPCFAVIKLLCKLSGHYLTSIYLNAIGATHKETATCTTCIVTVDKDILISRLPTAYIVLTPLLILSPKGPAAADLDNQADRRAALCQYKSTPGRECLVIPTTNCSVMLWAKSYAIILNCSKSTVYELKLNSYRLQCLNPEHSHSELTNSPRPDLIRVSFYIP